jgi:hypothetical protein
MKISVTTIPSYEILPENLTILSKIPISDIHRQTLMVRQRENDFMRFSLCHENAALPSDTNGNGFFDETTIYSWFSSSGKE